MKTSYQLLCDLELAIRSESPFPEGKKPDASYTAIRTALMAWPCANCGHAKYQHPTWHGHSSPECIACKDKGCKMFEPAVGQVPMDSDSTKKTVASLVQEKLSRGIRVFFVETFELEDGIGSRKKIIKEFEKLVTKGVLEPRVQVHSSSGHLCWEGSREAFAILAPFDCGECEMEIADPVELATEFYVARRSVSSCW